MTRPVAWGESYSLLEGGTVNAAVPGVLGNDTDGEGGPLTATLISAPLHGTLNLNSDGSFSYVHDGSETTSDSFVYQVSDGQGGFDTATVNLDITPVNDAPLATSDSYLTTAGQTLDVSAAAGVLANDFDPDSPNISVALAAGPANGTATLNADGSLTYVAADGFIGVDSLTYMVSDGNTTVGPVTVLLEVVVAPPPATGGGTGSTDGPDDYDTGTNDIDGEGTSGEGVVDGTSIAEPIVPISTSSDASGGATASQTPEHRSSESTSELVVIDVEATVGGIAQQADERDFVSRLRRDIELAIVRLSIDSDLDGYFQESNIMWENFNLLQKRILNDEASQRLAAGKAAVVSSAATIGYVLWTIRGGFMMATLMTSLPAWRVFDPMPILAGGRLTGKKDEESLEDIVVKSNQESS